MRKTLTTAIVALLFSTCIAMAGGPMIHLEMTETKSGAEPTEVSLNLPLEMLRTLEGNVNDALADVKLDSQEVDLREIWAQIKAAGPTDFVEIKDGNAYVKVSTDNTNVIILVQDSEEMGDMTITIPQKLGDALLGSDAVDFQSILDAVEDLAGQDLVRIEGDFLNLRIWVSA